MIDDCSGALFQDILSELLHIRIEEHGQHGAKEVLQWLDVQKDIPWLLLDRRWCLILIHGWSDRLESFGKNKSVVLDYPPGLLDYCTILPPQ